MRANRAVVATLATLVQSPELYWRWARHVLRIGIRG